MYLYKCVDKNVLIAAHLLNLEQNELEMQVIHCNL